VKISFPQDFNIATNRKPTF